jgi:hypothetical protein
MLTGAGDQPLSHGEPDRITIGDVVAGTKLCVQSVDTHDRCVSVPELDPDAVAPIASNACLTASLAAAPGIKPAP